MSGHFWSNGVLFEEVAYVLQQGAAAVGYFLKKKVGENFFHKKAFQ